MQGASWVRITSVAILGLVLGCGGGGGGDDDGITRGAWYTNVDILMLDCGPDVGEVLGSDVTYFAGNRVQISIYLDETDRCLPWTWELLGTETSPGVYDMDTILGDYLCALNESYGYDFFDITGATFVQDTAYDRVTGDFTAEYGGGTCHGQIFITLTPR